MSSPQIDSDIENLDDTPSLVAGPKRRQLSAVKKIGVVILVAFVFLAFIWVDHATQVKSAQKAPELPALPNAQEFKPAPLIPPVEASPLTPSTEAKQSGEVSPAESPLFAFAAGAKEAPGPSTGGEPGPAPGQIVPPLATKSGDPGQAIASLLKPTVTHMSRAAMLPNPDMVITKGTIIPCTLQTAINTGLAGFVKCVLPEAVRGTTGNVVLLDRGTTVIGEIQSGLVQGQKRVFVLWDRAETPQHALIKLVSPGADELGRAGLDGTVNNHFWDRFGSALMLSMVDGALEAGAAYAGSSGRGSGTRFNSFEGDSRQLVDSTLKPSIDIPPTLEKQQGENVSIFVANDLDFSSVYQLAMVK